MDELEFNKRLSSKVSSFDVSLMSNAKWRKLFGVLLAEQVSIRVSTIWSDSFSMWQSLKSKQGTVLQAKYLADGVLEGGPVLYEEIKALDIAKFEGLMNPQNGVIQKDSIKYNLVLKMILELGEFELEFHDDLVRIVAYK